MNNEPVAWMSTTGNNFVSKKAPSYVKAGTNDWIPLYTHPAKTQDRELLDKTIIDQQNEIKELRKNLDVALMIVNEPAKTLTNEEICELAVNNRVWLSHEIMMFAKAILRKAQEK
jgi:hypothetical protein